MDGVVLLSAVERVTGAVQIFNDALDIVPNGSRGTGGDSRKRPQGVGSEPIKASFLRQAN
jgi:hypothetical protein